MVPFCIPTSNEGQFLFHYFSNKFSISCSSSSPSGIPMIQMLVCLGIFQRLLILSSFFWILVSSFCSGWKLISSLCSKSLIWILASSPSLLVPYRSFFISLTANFISSFMLLPYSMSSLSILITSVLNSADKQPASDRLLITISRSSFPGVFFFSFIWAIFLCLLNLAASLCFRAFGRAALTPS